jgi:hypothetical protein
MAATPPGRWWMGRTRRRWAPRGSEREREGVGKHEAVGRLAGLALASTCGFGFRPAWKLERRQGPYGRSLLRLRGQYGLARWAPPPPGACEAAVAVHESEQA